MASRSIICRSRRLRQIIDLRDTDNSRYFAITGYNNCFIIRSPSLFFLMNIFGKRSDLPFSRKSDRKKEKSTVSITHEQNIICSQTVGWHCARLQVVPHFFLRDSRASETRASVKITPREKRRHAFRSLYYP